MNPSLCSEALQTTALDEIRASGASRSSFPARLHFEGGSNVASGMAGARFCLAVLLRVWKSSA
jgi:hypothetical protein